MASQIQFCRTVGVHHLQTRQSGPTLSTRLLEPAIQKYIMKEIKEEKKVEGVRRKNETPPEIKYFLGQGTSADTPEQAATLLLKREYPDIFHDLSGFGTIAIPEGFIPSISKIIDQDVIDKLDEETRKRYQDMIKKFPGDFAERIAYLTIKDYYKRMGSNTVLVQGLEIINLSNPSQHRESDFIIVNVEKRYILNIEVKNFLGPWIWNHGKSSNRKENKKQKNPDEKAKEQLEKNKANFEDWFGRDVGNGWHYLSAIFCMELHPDIKSHCSSCSTCDDFIIHREDELTEKLANIESRLPERENITKLDKEDFKTLIKYMLFSMPKKALPIGGNFTKAVRKAINEASDLDNIKVCAFPTKEQRLILSWKKAIVIAPWGCGKTWLMADKAIEFAKKGEKVVFGIFKKHTVQGEPLILYDLELKFQEFPNVSVKLIPFNVYKENNLKDYTSESNIFFGDEFSDTFFPYDDIAKDESITFLNSMDFCWLTMSNNIYERYDYLRAEFRNLREYIESWKPEDYHTIEMKTPIRSTKAIAKYLKENLSDEDFNTEMYQNCNLPSNMTEGMEIGTIGNNEYDPLQAFEECFSYLTSKGQDDGVLILTTSYEWREDELRRDIDCKCKDDRGILCRIAFVLVLQELGRDQPLFHLFNFTSGRDVIKRHITIPKLKQDLVADRSLAKGYESEKVIICNIQEEYLSRGSIAGVILKYDPKVFASYGFNWIRRNPQHKCGALPKLISDHEIFESMGLSRSNTLQGKQCYSSGDCNPILACLHDHCNSDPDVKGTFSTESELLSVIIADLKSEKLNWKLKWTLKTMRSSVWIRKMEANRNFYHERSNNEDFETILLELASQFLKRKIIVFPVYLNGPQPEMVFEPPKPSQYFKTFYIYKRMSYKDYFMSVHKD